MSGASRPAIAAVDWGTTRLLDADGTVLDERCGDDGMLAQGGAF